MKRKIARLTPFIFFLILILFFWRGLSLEPQKLPSAQLGRTLPAFQLPILGEQKKLLASNRLFGQIALLNVWASWCDACVEEQIFLMKLAHQGVPIFGLNYKDTSKKALQWLANWGNPYQVVWQDKTGKTAIDLGVYGTPETFLIDAKGVIRFRHVGILSELDWEHDFLPRIRRLQGQL